MSGGPKLSVTLPCRVGTDGWGSYRIVDCWGKQQPLVPVLRRLPRFRRVLAAGSDSSRCMLDMGNRCGQTSLWTGCSSPCPEPVCVVSHWSTARWARARSTDRRQILATPNLDALDVDGDPEVGSARPDG